jgi:hypothetical protein
MPAVGLSNTAPTTLLVTHGGLAIALLLYLVPRPAVAEEPGPQVDCEAKQRTAAANMQAGSSPARVARGKSKDDAGWFPEPPFGNDVQDLEQHGASGH